MPKMHSILNSCSKRQRSILLAQERKRRHSGNWGEWETMYFLPGTVGGGWTAFITTAHKNKVFSVLDRYTESGARHLAVSSLSGIRPTWHEMQRIKDELASPDATAVEVYPPSNQVVDDADMFHIWILPKPLPFGINQNNER